MTGQPLRQPPRRFTTRELKDALRAGPYTQLGCYPRYFLADDGEALSFAAVRREFRQVLWAMRQRQNNGWRVVAVCINYEDADLTCAHTGERIPSAYADA